MKTRLSTGLVKLRESAAQVADMQIQLKDEAIVVEAKKQETDVLLVQVGQESAVADEQAELGAIEAEKVAAIQQEVSAFRRSARPTSPPRSPRCRRRRRRSTTSTRARSPSSRR